MADLLGGAASSGDDDGQTASFGFDDDVAVGFGVGGEDEQVGTGIDPAQVSMGDDASEGGVFAEQGLDFGGTVAFADKAGMDGQTPIQEQAGGLGLVAVRDLPVLGRAADGFERVGVLDAQPLVESAQDAAFGDTGDRRRVEGLDLVTVVEDEIRPFELGRAGHAKDEPENAAQKQERGEGPGPAAGVRSAHARHRTRRLGGRKSFYGKGLCA